MFGLSELGGYSEIVETPEQIEARKLQEAVDDVRCSFRMEEAVKRGRHFENENQLMMALNQRILELDAAARNSGMRFETPEAINEGIKKMPKKEQCKYLKQIRKELDEIRAQNIEKIRLAKEQAEAAERRAKSAVTDVITPSEALKAQVLPEFKFDSKEIADIAAKRTAQERAQEDAAKAAQKVFNAPFEAGLSNKDARESVEFFEEQFRNEAIEEATSRTAKEVQKQKVAEVCQAAYNAPFEAGLSNKDARESAEFFVEQAAKKAKRNKYIALGITAVAAMGAAIGLYIHHKKNTNQIDKKA